METRNKILIVGSDLDTRNEIIEKSFVKELKWKDSHIKKLKSSVFNIKNKYYSADVEFWTYEEDDIEILEENKEVLGEIVDAVIIVSNRQGYIQNSILKWIHIFVEEFGPNVLLYTSFEQPSESIVEWCHDNQFEIVCVNNQNFEELETDIIEKVGFERIYEALEANMWENMVYMTDLRPQNIETSNSKVLLENDDEIHNDLNELNDMFLKGLKFENEDNFEEQIEHFENVVNKLNRMKKMAESLPDDKRREVAASIALSLSSLLGDEE